MSTTKATLIQASNNTATQQPIFTFKLEYPLNKTFWQRLFKQEAKQITSYVTLLDNWFPVLPLNINSSTYNTLIKTVKERIDFAKYIFESLNGKTKNVISGKDVQKAIDLFGPRMNEILKQYDGNKGGPSEVHDPPVPESELNPDKRVSYHRYAATPSSGIGANSKGWVSF